MILDVVQVVLQLALCVFDRRAVWVTYLCPAGHAGLDAVTNIVKTNLVFQTRHKGGRSGRGPTRLISPLNTLNN